MTVRPAIFSAVGPAAWRAGSVPPVSLDEAFYDGIHLDFRRGRHYIKVPGGAATVAPFTTLFTFTGDNKSMYRGQNGLLTASVTNTPRIEYDSGGNLLGLLIEGARTNIGLWSDDGTNAAWVKSNMTNAKTSTGPDGVANSATRLTASAGNATILQTVTSGSATRAYSVWLKRITGTGTINLTVDNGSTWTAKTITTDWARYDISQAAVTNPVFGIRIVTSGDAVDFYGNQLESAAFPSSYIPTTTASVARAADVASRAFGSEISQTAGTCLVDFDLIAVDTGGGAGQQTIVALDGGDATTNELIRMRQDTNAWTICGVIDGGVGQANVQCAGTPNTSRHKAILTYQVNDFHAALDGVLAASPDVSGTLPTPTTMWIGQRTSGGTTPIFGHIRRLDYWPERKSNAFLQQVTA